MATTQERFSVADMKCTDYPQATPSEGMTILSNSVLPRRRHNVSRSLTNAKHKGVTL